MQAGAAQDGAGTIEHVASADASAKLDRLRGSGLIERGGVVLIGLDMIKANLGERWSRRVEQVLEQTERKIKARLSDADMYARISETGFILCFSTLPAVAAHGMAVRILEEIVLHFLGSCATQNLVVQTVRSLNGNSIAAEPLDIARLTQLRSEEAQDAAAEGAAPETFASLAATDSAVASEEEAPKAEAEEPTGPIVSLRDTLRVEWDVESVINLKQRAAAAVRIRPRLTDVRTGTPVRWTSLGGWPTPALVELECGFIGGAVELAQGQRPSERRGIIVPLSIHTLSTGRGRMEIVRRLTELPTTLQKRLVIEISGVSSDTPPGHLQEALGFLRPRARAVIVQPRLTKSTFAMLRYAQIDGLCACAKDLGHDAREVTTNMIAFALSAREVASMTLVTGISSQALTDCAEGAGITHVSVRKELITCAPHPADALPAAC